MGSFPQMPINTGDLVPLDIGTFVTLVAAEVDSYGLL